MVKKHDFPKRISPSLIVESGATNSQVRYGTDLELPFSEARSKPLMPIPISGRIKVRFKKSTPLQYVPVEIH